MSLHFLKYFLPLRNQMAKHNIVLVVYHFVKNNAHLEKRRSIVSVENDFLNELPSTLQFWSDA
jgi:hypothetical protein